MKASEVIQQYQDGQRTFRKLNLRGANFAGEDLSEADFSGCDIRGANFQKANLTGAKFIDAKAGLTFRAIFCKGFLLCLLATFPQYFLFQTFKFPIFSISSTSKIINTILFIIFIIFHCWYFLWNSISEKLLFIAEVYVIFGMITTAFAIVEWRIINAEIYIILGVSTFFITLISAIFIGSFWVIFENQIIYLFPLAFSIIGFIEGYLGSNESQSVMVSGFVISIVGWFSGSFISWRGLKEDEKHNWIRPVILLITSLKGTTFYKATLTDADFTGANLKNTRFNQAIITRTCFKNTTKLSFAIAEDTILVNPKVRDLLINPISGNNINLFKADLRGANLDGANLQKANLKQADLSQASLSHANLTDANLTEINAVKTNFSHATLTGACIEAWNIDATTILDNIECDYVFLLNNQKERRPSSGKFQGEEFTKLFEEVFDTVDLIFRNGIDWKAFISAMEEVQVENEETPIAMQTIENKGDGVFVVKVRVPPEANKKKIHQEVNEKYELKSRAIEVEVKATFNVEDSDIARHRRENTNIMKIIDNQPTLIIQINQNQGSNMTNIYQNHSGSGDNVGGNKTIQPNSPNLDILLEQLIQAINSETELGNKEKTEAINQVKEIEKASHKTDDEGLQKKAKQAVNLLQTLAKGLEPASKLANAFTAILPKIITFLGL